MKAPRSRAVLFAAVLAGISGLSIELVLRGAERASARVRQVLASPWDAESAPTIPDARVELRPNPALRGHDANGFRNPRVPERSEIVVLGDSQTYGTGVPAEASWPRVLERISARSTYAMAAGGYGPVHELLLLDDALELRPNLVIQALYSGNDLYDAYRLVYEHGAMPELRSAEREAEVRAEEQARPMSATVERLFGECFPPLAAAAAVPSDRGDSLLARFARHSRLYALARRARYEWSGTEVAPAASAERVWEAALAALRDREHCLAFEAQGARTVLTPEYRWVALDPGDPRIQEGQRIALRAIAEMKRRTAAAGIRFLLVLIPTKELVFEALGAPEKAPARLAALVSREREIWRQVEEFLIARDIEFVALLEPLRAELRNGPQPYQVTADGHPNPTGHEVIALSVAARLSGAVE